MASTSVISHCEQKGVRRAIWGLTAAIAPRRPAPSPLAVRHAMPAVFESRDLIAAGDLMSYGGSLTDFGDSWPYPVLSWARVCRG
jgi:hypothetical protein